MGDRRENRKYKLPAPCSPRVKKFNQHAVVGFFLSTPSWTPEFIVLHGAISARPDDAKKVTLGDF
jgi:hypothetical protein